MIVNLGKHQISRASPPYIIAEIGVNHEGSMSTAKHLIELAKEGGAQCAKFQTYKAGKLASINSPAYWDRSKEATASQYELFKKLDGFGEDEYRELAEHCKKLDIDFLSTPFDIDAVETLDEISTYFKLASADILNVPLLRAIGAKQKPVVMSTGAAGVEEINFAIRELEGAGATDIVLLHCVLNYPTLDKNANLGMIKGLRDEFNNHLVGYSDHTLPNDRMDVLTSAYLMGAVVLEKHFTHDKKLQGNDHYHAMDVDDLKNFWKSYDRLAEISGENYTKKALAEEAAAIKHARRSIVAHRNIKTGEILTENNLTTKRPGHGICSSLWDSVIGKTAVVDISQDEILTNDMIK